MTATKETPVRHGTPQTYIADPSWRTFDDNVYACRALVIPEPSGGYSVHALRLPGVVSQGETIEEALDNISEAFRGAIQVYRESGENIPWQDIDIDRPKGSVERWNLVDV